MDQLQKIAYSSVGRAVFPRLGLPQPPILRRYEPGQALLTGPAVLGAAPGGRLLAALDAVLKAAGVEVLAPEVRGVEGRAAEGGGAEARRAGGVKVGALVFDATGITTSDDLVALFEFFGPKVRSVNSSGRVVVFGQVPALVDDPRERAAQRALEGFTRALGKEIGHGSTVQLVQVAPGAEGRIASTLRFLLSARSAFVDGQVIRVGTDVTGADDVEDWSRPLAGQVVVVTGASRGIGEAITRTLARDGATVVGVDIPALASDLRRVTREVGGSAIALDVTAVDAGPRIARHARENHGKLDGVVHNAGITRDKKLANMKEAGWASTIAVNLTAPERITAALLEEGLLKDGGRVVVISSVAGIAGNAGQTNYATSKAGLIGMVDALAPRLATRGVTINAVAPGFIETQMTARIPLAIREGGRRLSSMLQGGQPVDVAETIGWYLSPASSGVTGNLVRVCGQALIGA